MAEGKKGFILYADIIHTVSQLSDIKAGKLFKHILEYVNDKDPETKDQIINLVFEPIKQQLKRDLQHWDEKKTKRAEAGRLGGLAKASNAKQKLANLAVIVKDNVSVNDIVNVNDNEKVINEWIVLNCNGFSEELKQWIEIIEAKYNNQTSIIQIESWLRLLNGWYKTNDYKKECLNKHIAGPWKTLNFVKVEELNSTYKKQTSEDFEL